jgi:hypothetical protein
MKLSMRSLKGKLRQNRGLLFSQIESQVNLGAKYLLERQISVDTACQEVSDRFEILILASTNDLPLALENARRLKALHGEQVVKTTIVSQKSHSEASRDLLFLTDEELGISEEISKVLGIFGDRGNWMKQQYLKSKFVHRAENPVLIIDSDTFLNISLCWKHGMRQILLINVEDFHMPYNVHIAKFLGTTPPALNFVSHIQMQEPAIVREIYSSDFDKGWEHWARSSWKFGEDSPASEFQTYASYLLNRDSDISIVFPKHVTISGEGKTLSEVLDSEVAYASDIVTIGQKSGLNPNFK